MHRDIYMLKDKALSMILVCVRIFRPSLMPQLKLCSRKPYFYLMILQTPEFLSFAHNLGHSFSTVSSFCLNPFRIQMLDEATFGTS